MKQPMTLQNWPFGRGVLMTAIAVEDGVGAFWVMACPDGFTEADGKPCEEAWQEAKELNAPRVAFFFPSEEAVDGVIENLQQLKAEMAKGGNVNVGSD